MNKLLAILIAVSVGMILSGCDGGGGGSNFILGGGGSTKTGTLTLGLSDAPIDDVNQVVIEIDTITLRKTGEDDLMIEQFTSTDLGIIDAETFQIDLLEYLGNERAIVIENLELPAGNYNDMILSILDEDINNSFVVEVDNNAVKAIKVPSDTLKLGGFTVEADGNQSFIIEFDLRQAMTYKPGPDEYSLKPRGIRLQDIATTTFLNGEVDSSLFNSEAPCDGKSDPTLGNVIYLYEGHGLEVANLVDVLDPEVASDAPAAAIEPFSAQSLVQNSGGDWEYHFSFLPAGDYTLIFSCNAEDDDPEQFDNLELPFPSDQIIELPAVAGGGVSCNFPISDNNCAL